MVNYVVLGSFLTFLFLFLAVRLRPVIWHIWQRHRQQLRGVWRLWSGLWGAMRQSFERRIQQGLPTHSLRNNIFSGNHWQWISRSCHGLPEKGQKHDRQVPAPSLCGWPPVCYHAALLGRGCSQDLVLWRSPLRGRAHDLHSQPVQQCPDPGLH